LGRRVSIPLAASAIRFNAVANGSPAASPARSIMLPMPIRPKGWPRSLMRT
jgi:hypothetical protein